MRIRCGFLKNSEIKVRSTTPSPASEPLQGQQLAKEKLGRAKNPYNQLRLQPKITHDVWEE